MRMKIVTARHVEDVHARSYLFETSKNLKKGDYVLLTHSDEEVSGVGICTQDSMELRADVLLKYLEYDSPWKLPLAKVVGKMDLWKEAKEITDEE